MSRPRTALLSVSKKDGIIPFAKGLREMGWELVSSGGTAAALGDAGIPVIPIERVTGNPEAFGGRMKTISFAVESGILFDRDDPAHREQAALLGIRPIDMVACNFYPFLEAATGSPGLPVPEACELIDIGGPTMVRAAAKNFRHVIPIVDPGDYGFIRKELEEKGDLDQVIRLVLAAKAFKYTADYDGAIDIFLTERALRHAVMRVRFAGGRPLRYGENPHQKGFFFPSDGNDPLGIGRANQLAGKELSFNNILDLDALLGCLSALGGERPAAVVVKHTNPCGAAYGGSGEEAFRRAWEGDELAAYGGVVGMNRPLTPALARDLLERKRFAEVIFAPAVDPDAAALLTERRKNLILLENPALVNPLPSTEMDLKKVRGGVLLQEPDVRPLRREDLQVVTGELEEGIVADCLLAWTICRHSKSNSVVLARDGQLVGSGVGQQDRKRCCQLAADKAGERARGAVAASDAFFPFPDGPEILIAAGVRAILHPGGSIRDQETVDVCRTAGVTLVTTGGLRAFRH